MSRELTLSVVIGTKDRQASLQRCLQSIVAQSRRPDEIIIVDDGSLDYSDLQKILESSRIVFRYLNKSRDPGLTKSRNLGIRESAGDIVMFLDDDVVLDKMYITAIVQVYKDYPTAGGVTGSLSNVHRSFLKNLFLRVFMLDSRDQGSVMLNGMGSLIYDIETLKPVQWFSGCQMSFRKEVFSELMFDEEFKGNGWGDDRDFSFSVSKKYSLLATPKALVQHLEDPAGRTRPQQFGRMEIEYAHRFFMKHMPQKMTNWLALVWSMLGITLKNALILNPRRMVGNLQALGRVISKRG